jgi:hypothetical protein
MQPAMGGVVLEIGRSQLRQHREPNRFGGRTRSKPRQHARAVLLDGARTDDAAFCRSVERLLRSAGLAGVSFHRLHIDGCQPSMTVAAANQRRY